MSTSRGGILADAPLVGQYPFRRVVWRAWNRRGSALVAGNVVQFDTSTNTTAEGAANSIGILLPSPSTYAWGDKPYPTAESAWHNVFLPAAAKIASGIFGVALDDASDNEPLRVLVAGRVTVNAIGVASTTYTAGSFLRVTPGGAHLTHKVQSLNATFSAPEVYTFAAKNVALLLETYTEAGTPAQRATDVFFNGFGIGAAA